MERSGHPLGFDDCAVSVAYMGEGFKLQNVFGGGVIQGMCLHSKVWSKGERWALILRTGSFEPVSRRFEGNGRTRRSIVPGRLSLCILLREYRGDSLEAVGQLDASGVGVVMPPYGN